MLTNIITFALGIFVAIRLGFLSFVTHNGPTQAPTPVPTPNNAPITQTVDLNVTVNVPPAPPVANPPAVQPQAQAQQPAPAPARNTPAPVIVPQQNNFPWGWLLGLLAVAAIIVFALVWYNTSGDVDRKIGEVASMGGNTLVKEEVIPMNQGLNGTQTNRHFVIQRNMIHVPDASSPAVIVVVRDGWKVRVLNAQGQVVRDYSKGEKVALHPGMVGLAYEYYY